MSKYKLQVVCLIMFVNALGLSMVVPIMYPLAKTYGLPKNKMGLLIATFSVAQLVASPFLGSLSDKFGRKLILLLCLLGSAISFLMIAFSNSVVWLFASRIVDGLTGGNASILNSTVSDISTETNRIKLFGYLSASFSSGILFGPVLSGYFSIYSLKLPFFIATGVSLASFLVCLFLFSDEKQDLLKKASHTNVILSFLKAPALYKNFGKQFIITISIVFLLALCQFSLTIGFQTFNYDILALTPSLVAVSYVTVSIFTTIMQTFGIKLIQAKIKNTYLLFSILMLAGSIALIFASKANFYMPFTFFMIVYYVSFSIKDPIINSSVAEISDKKSQGVVFGVTQSFSSLGQILGLLTADFIITVSSPRNVFLFCSFLLLIAFFIILRRNAISKNLLSQV